MMGWAKPLKILAPGGGNSTEINENKKGGFSTNKHNCVSSYA